MEKDKWDLYFIDGTGTLNNKFNIVDSNELRKKEVEITLNKLTNLYINPIKGNFDAEHLIKIHKYLFDDIYYFAGKYRNVNIMKNVGSPFMDYKNIEKELNDYLKDIDSKVLKNSNSHFLYAENLAKLYHRLIQIHPFREGNGRAIREFLREYVEAKNSFFEDCNYELDFNSKNIDRKKLYEGTISSNGQIGELTLQIYNALTRKEKTKNKVL